MFKQRPRGSTATPEDSSDTARIDQHDQQVGGTQYNIAGNYVAAITPDIAADLLALRDLIQRSADVHAAVVVFRADFQATHEQVDRLSRYKEVHDLLHRVQFSCYEPIAQSALRFPHGDWVLDDLAGYALNLEGIFDELVDIAAQSLLPSQDLVWIGELGFVGIDLAIAIATQDALPLKNVIWRLNRLLAIQPARINVLLNYAARAVRLSSLSNALAHVCDHLVRLEFGPEKVRQFQEGVDALAQLDQSLRVLVEAHDLWQAVDVELRRINTTLERDLLDLSMSWPDVKSRAQPLYITYSDEWADALRKDGDDLDAALLIKNPMAVRRSFRSYMRRATNRFYRVDHDLKNLCGSLRDVGIPLASVLRMLE